MTRLTQSLRIGGRDLGGVSEVNVATENATGVTIPAGKTGTLSTRTDNETGTLTMAEGHGITTGQVIDLYWDGGLRRAVLVGTVATNSVPIGADNGGKGDNLPAQGTAIVACVRQIVDLDVDGDTVVMAGADVSIGCRASIEFEQDDGTSIHALDLEGTSSEKGIWTQVPGATNVFEGAAIGRVAVSNGTSTSSCVVQFGLARDNVS